MKPQLQKTPDGCVECVNILPGQDWTLSVIEPQKNAVIVQLFELHHPDGSTKTQRVISIECKDESMYEALKAEASRMISLSGRT